MVFTPYIPWLSHFKIAHTFLSARKLFSPIVY